MNYSYNLIDKPWIPCLTHAGTRTELSLHDTLLKAHQMRELFCDSPLETVALYRLLLAVMYWVYHLDDQVWGELWQRRETGLDPATIANQWVAWRHRFDLFDESHPFYQIADESQLGQRSPVNKMIPQLTPSDTLFDHRISDAVTGVKLTPAEAARALITNQLYGLGYNQFVDAPCAKGVVFLIQGATLLETILLNLLRYPQEDGPYRSSRDDAPAWAQENVFEFPFDGERVSRDAKVELKAGKRTLKYDNHIPLGQLDYLTWHNRKTKLIPTGPLDNPEVRQIAWAPGLRLESDITDPMQHYDQSKDGWSAYVLRPERALWRDLTTFVNISADMATTRPVAAIRRLAFLAQQFEELRGATPILATFAIAKDRASLFYIRQERTPLPTDLLLKPELAGHLGQGLRAADRVALVVRRASFALAWMLLYPATALEKVQGEKDVDAKFTKGSSKNSRNLDAKRAYMLQTSWGVERVYWSSLENHFHWFIQGLPQSPDEAIQIWRGELRRAARDAFNITQEYAGGDRRAMRAAAVANQLFNRGLSKVLGSNYAPVDTSEGVKMSEMEEKVKPNER